MHPKSALRYGKVGYCTHVACHSYLNSHGGLDCYVVPLTISDLVRTRDQELIFCDDINGPESSSIMFLLNLAGILQPLCYIMQYGIFRANFVWWMDRTPAGSVPVRCYVLSRLSPSLCGPRHGVPNLPGPEVFAGESAVHIWNIGHYQAFTWYWVYRMAVLVGNAIVDLIFGWCTHDRWRERGYWAKHIGLSSWFPIRNVPIYGTYLVWFIYFTHFSQTLGLKSK